jgi:WD40 repeat protein
MNAPSIAVPNLAISQDGRWLAAGHEDRIVRIWDTTTGEVIRTLRGHEQAIHGCAFSPDGRRLASSGRTASLTEPGELIIWDTALGTECLRLRGHTASVFGLVFSPDGQRLASASADGTIRIWNAAPLP